MNKKYILGNQASSFFDPSQSNPAFRKIYGQGEIFELEKTPFVAKSQAAGFIKEASDENLAEMGYDVAKVKAEREKVEKAAKAEAAKAEAIETANKLAVGYRETIRAYATLTEGKTTAELEAPELKSQIDALAKVKDEGFKALQDAAKNAGLKVNAAGELTSK